MSAHYTCVNVNPCVYTAPVCTVFAFVLRNPSLSPSWVISFEQWYIDGGAWAPALTVYVGLATASIKRAKRRTVDFNLWRYSERSEVTVIINRRRRDPSTDWGFTDKTTPNMVHLLDRTSHLCEEIVCLQYIYRRSINIYLNLRKPWFTTTWTKVFDLYVYCYTPLFFFFRVTGGTREFQLWVGGCVGGGGVYHHSLFLWFPNFLCQGQTLPSGWRTPSQMLQNVNLLECIFLLSLVSYMLAWGPKQQTTRSGTDYDVVTRGVFRYKENMQTPVRPLITARVRTFDLFASKPEHLPTVHHANNMFFFLTF